MTGYILAFIACILIVWMSISLVALFIIKKIMKAQESIKKEFSSRRQALEEWRGKRL